MRMATMYFVGFVLMSCKEIPSRPSVGDNHEIGAPTEIFAGHGVADSGIFQLIGTTTSANTNMPTAGNYPAGILAFVPTHYNMSAAIAPDGSIYWTEFGKMRLMRYGSKGLEVVLANTPGLYGVAVDAKGRVYVGQDMSDNPFSGGPDAGKFQGSVSRVDFDKANKTILTKLIKYIRRPRQLLIEGTTIFLTLEAERRIISCANIDTRTTPCIPKPTGEAPKSNDDKNYFKTELTTNAISPPNGLAYRDGVFYWAETGIYQLNADNTKWIEKGRVRSSSGKPGEQIKTVVEGLGRARGLGFDAAGNLYVTCESEDKDEGNTGTLGVITPHGKYTTLLSGLDYPQFPAVYPNGSILITTARENFMLLYQPNLKFDPLKSGYQGTELYGSNFSTGTTSSKNQQLILEFTDLKKAFSFTVTSSNANAKYGWLNVDINSLNLPKELINRYKIEPAERSALVPGPGWFRTPPVKCSIGGKPCAAKVLIRRTQGGWRWPMTYPHGIEMPFPGFTENPDKFLVNFFW